MTQGRIPLWIKLPFTAFVAVLVPIYWRDYGPSNFLYFCDVALLMTVVAIWTESSLWASAPLVGIFVPQLLWQTDFLVAATGGHLTGLTGYMFDVRRDLFLRFLSFFHFWLPILLFYMVWRLGYDRRAWLTWTLLGWVLLLVCYFFMPPPPAPEDNPNMPNNINYVYGLSEVKQQLMDDNLWFTLEMIILPLGFWLPTHLGLAWMFSPPQPKRIESCPNL